MATLSDAPLKNILLQRGGLGTPERPRGTGGHTSPDLQPGPWVLGACRAKYIPGTAPCGVVFLPGIFRGAGTGTRVRGPTAGSCYSWWPELPARWAQGTSPPCCSPSQKWHKSGGFGNPNDSLRLGRISPFSRGCAVVIQGPKKPPDGGGGRQHLGSPHLPGAKSARNGQILTLGAGLAPVQPVGQDGCSAGTKGGRDRSCAPPQHRSPLPNPCECHGSAPSLPVHICTHLCKRQGCVWAWGGFSHPPQGIFFFSFAWGWFGCLWPGWGPSTCHRICPLSHTATAWDRSPPPQAPQTTTSPWP